MRVCVCEPIECRNCENSNSLDRFGSARFLFMFLLENANKSLGCLDSKEVEEENEKFDGERNATKINRILTDFKRNSRAKTKRTNSELSLLAHILFESKQCQPN